MRLRSAFTLIEVLVVIAIVAILAVLAVSSYGVARQKARMDIAVDTVMSVLKQQQSLAKSGKGREFVGGAGAVAACYGMYFEKGAVPAAQRVKAPYVSVDPSISATDSDFCDMRKGFYVLEDLKEIEDYKISDLKKFGADADSLVVLFRPPLAKISLGGLENPDNVPVTNDPLVTVTIESSNGADNRSFSFDVSSGRIERTTQKSS